MPSTWFAWGAPLLQRHWSLRWGECAHCGEVGFCPSYVATKMAVAAGLPWIPLGKVHVHEECTQCGVGASHGLDAWEQEREEALIPALDAFATKPGFADACSQALQQLVERGELEEFLPVAEQAETQFVDSPQILSQLAWCYGRFAQFDEARRLYARVAQLDDRPERHEMSRAYESIPESSPPSPPSPFLQGLRVLLVPVLLGLGITAFLSYTLKGRVDSVYVVNGRSQAYDVVINGQQLSLPPYGRERITLTPGAVSVTSVDGGFEPFQFDLKARQGSQPVTAVINPDRLAIISWEELVYQNTETEGAQANADLFALHAVEPYYLFFGITDHFQDPPEALEIHSEHSETYRYVLDEVPESLCGLLLDQGDPELAESYFRLRLKENPDQTDLLAYLLKAAPDEGTLTFMESFLADRPVRMSWHKDYVALAQSLGLRAKVKARYEALVKAEPEDGALSYLLGTTRQESEMAIADFERAANLGSIEALLPLARRHTFMGEFVPALLQMNQALSVRPGNEDFESQREELLLATGKFAPLIETYRKRLDEDPLNQQAATTLAGLYEANGQTAHAQLIVDQYVKGVSLDGALVSEETAASRRYFASVRAQWVGDIERFVAVGERMDESGAFNTLLLKGDYVAAAATVDRAAIDPFLHFLLYALTTKAGGNLALSEVQLSQALSLLEETSAPLAAILKPWFRAGAPAPTEVETLRAGLPNDQRRVLLFALAQRHPGGAAGYLKLARKLNYHRVFPYLALKQAIGSESKEAQP